MVTLRLLAVLLLLSINTYALIDSPELSNGLSFIENRGQVTDQFHHVRNDVDFHVRTGSGLNIFIGDGAIRYQFSRSEETTAKSSIPDYDVNEHTTYLMHRVDVELLGANADAEVAVAEGQAYFEHYYTAGIAAGHTATAAYGKIIYRNIYTNIDWVLYMANGRMKQEFVVWPGGKVSDIQLRYSGQEQIKIEEDGSLLVKTSLGNITEDAPVCYMEHGVEVAGKYELSGNILTYVTGNYEGMLTIDPAVSWATYHGANTVFNTIVADSTGQYMYIAGNTASTQNIATTGAHQSTIGGSTDAYLKKFSAAGLPIWGTYFGGQKLDYGEGLALSYHNTNPNTSHYIYLTGYTHSDDNIATPNAHDTSQEGLGDGYLAKFTDSGALVWSTYFGAARDERTSCVFVDGVGHVYIGGYSYSQSRIATPGVHQVVPNLDSNYSDGMVAQFNDLGVLQWATYYGGQQTDVVISITGSGNDIYIAGNTTSTDSISTPVAYQPVAKGQQDGFVAKLTSSGSRVWGTYLGGEANDWSQKLAHDSKGDIYVCGSTRSMFGIASSGSHRSILTGAHEDGFLAKINPAGIVLWSTYVGGNDTDFLRDVVVDEFDDVYVVGGTSTDINLVTSNNLQANYGGGPYDAYMGKFSPTGMLLWSTYYGGSNVDIFYGAAAAKQDIYLCGGTWSSTGIATLGAHKTTISGSSDGFLLRACDTTPVLNKIYGTHDICFNSRDTLESYYKNGSWHSVYGHVAISSSGIVTPLSAGADTVLYLATNACGTDTTRHAINVHLSPFTSHPVSTAGSNGGTAQFTVTATGSNIYQWQMDNGSGFQDIVNGGQYSGANANVLTVSNLTTQNNLQSYRCKVQGEYCDTTSFSAQLYVWPLSVQHIANTSISYTPNPATDYIEVKASEVIETIAITNLLGQVVLSKSVQGKQLLLDISQLKPGVFILSVNSVSIGKLVKQ